MGLRIIRPDQIATDSKQRIGIYGRAGIGKSRFALSIPDDWGKIAYYAADKNSENLSSIDKKKRERIIVIKPEGDDPIKNFMAFAMHNWKKEDENIGTIIVDTFTKVGLDSIRHSANSGAVTSEKHYIIGDPSVGGGGQTIPNRGDYLGVASLARGFLDMLFDKQEDMHIILVQHEDIKLIENTHAVGGPAFPGREMLEYIPAQLDTVIRLIRQQILVPGAAAPEDVVVAITENDGKFISKIRTDDEVSDNPLAHYVLDRTSTNFWKKFQELHTARQ